MICEQTISDQLISEQAISKQAISEQAISEQAISEQAISEQACQFTTRNKFYNLTIFSLVVNWHACSRVASSLVVCSLVLIPTVFFKPKRFRYAH